jgi:plastocyanin
VESAGDLQDAVKTLLWRAGLLATAASVIPGERGDGGLLPACPTTVTTRESAVRCAANDARPQAIDTTITLRASGSTLEFDPPRISVRNGRRVRLRFVNGGTLPHNVVVPRSEDDLDGLILAAYESSETGYVPMAQQTKLVGYTRLASPGETVEFVFTVPPPGEYTYVCLFPGHANSMLGTLRSLK